MRPISATIDSAALRHNLGVVRRHAPRSKVLAVLKANAYGHGMLRAAGVLSDADGFAVLEAENALHLRDAGFRQPIVLLEGFFGAADLQSVIAGGISTVVHCTAQIDALDSIKDGAKVDVLLKINTGMNRLGFPPQDYPQAISRLRRNPRIGSITLMTHFAEADEARGVEWQMQVLRGLPDSADLPKTFANSAAILRYPDTHSEWVRPGIMLYGCSPFTGRTGAEEGLRPVMTLESRIIAVQELKAGDTVGYGGTFHAERAMRIGVVACGYADGYPRHAPNGTPVCVEGRMTGTVGRVSMDMLCVDLSAVAEARIGSRVVLWGEPLPVERVAEAAGTVSYQLLCAVAPRVQIVER